MKRCRRRERGFTLLELVIVLGVAGVLASLAIQGTGMYVQRARRSEARMGLAAIYDAQHTFFQRNTRYAATFDELDFSFHGGERISATQITGRIYTFRLSQPSGIYSWYCSASANVDADDWPDVLVMAVGTDI